MGVWPLRRDTGTRGGPVGSSEAGGGYRDHAGPFKCHVRFAVRGPGRPKRPRHRTDPGDLLGHVRRASVGPGEARTPRGRSLCESRQGEQRGGDRQIPRFARDDKRGGLWDGKEHEGRARAAREAQDRTPRGATEGRTAAGGGRCRGTMAGRSCPAGASPVVRVAGTGAPRTASFGRAGRAERRGRERPDAGPAAARAPRAGAPGRRPSSGEDAAGAEPVREPTGRAAGWGPADPSLRSG